MVTVTISLDFNCKYMKQYLFLISALLLTVSAAAPKNNGALPQYDAVLSFNSMCCGPPTNDFLKSFLTQFNKANKVKVKARLLGGCGKEGEYVIVLSFAGLTAKTKPKLTAQLNALVSKQNTANRAANNVSGNIDIQYNVPPNQLAGCRIPVTDWKY